ncbi:uncharacterized protein DEA37_0009218 [Paragonimus westermani]|uniref:Uncharacterized protein n=1 Tax=Paragonimus westermani TaxID=34504 RepID=A0A5J4NHI8_9TREM|nr:uncharacterized protein DEA37_0009218 [Paragonimus westermani]
MDGEITNKDDGISSVCCFDGRQFSTNHDLSDLSDTVEDVTTDSISNGKLKGDLRILRAQLISKSLLLESDHLLFKSKDHEYQEQIQTLSRRLALASRRCEAAMQVATQVNAIQSELHKAVINQKCLQAEKEALANEVAAVRQLMSTLVTDHFIYTTKSEVDLFEIDVGAYSQLRGSNLYQLSSLNSAELSVKQYVQLQIHRLVILFAEELLRLRRQLNESAKFTFLENPGSTPNHQSREAEANCNSTVRRLKKWAKSLAQETHNAELTIMREQRNQSILDADQLRARLDQAQQEMESQKHHLQSLLKGQSRSKGLFGVHDDDDDGVGYSAQERLVRAMIEAENAQAARADALLKVEKLTSQLDATKLEVYEKLERQLDEALEDAAYFKPNSEMADDKEADLFEHIKQFGFPTDAVTSGVTLKAGCVTLPSLSARRLEHAMKLAKQVAVLKRESQKLLEQLDKKNKEIELAHQNAEKLSTIVSLSGQPVDTLACRLAEREAQLKAIRERLSVTEERLREQTAERECLLTERNSLANDLNRLLNRRQTLTKLRKQLATVLEHSTNQPNTSFRSPRLCSCPCVCKHSCQSATGCVRKRIISCRRQLSRTESPTNFRPRSSPAPYDTDRS